MFGCQEWDESNSRFKCINLELSYVIYIYGYWHREEEACGVG